jgi:protein SCO1/2
MVGAVPPGWHGADDGRPGQGRPAPDAAVAPAGGAAALYARLCRSCHGRTGKGDGPAASGCSTPPGDLTRATGRRAGARVEEIAQVLAQGVPGTAMGGYRHLPEPDRAALARWVAMLASAPGRPAPRAGPGGAPAADVPGVEPRLGATVPGNLVLRDEGGRPVPLGALLTLPSLLTLNYFRCEGICSPQLNGLAEAIGRIKAVPGKDFQVLTVSFDSRDTPEVAAGKREAYLRLSGRAMPAASWRFLTGDGRTTQALADAVGFGFQRRGDGYAHPAVLVALDDQGRIVQYLFGVSYVPEDLERAVRLCGQSRMTSGPAGRPAGCRPSAAASGSHRFSLPTCLLASLLLCGLIFLASSVVRRLFRRHG